MNKLTTQIKKLNQFNLLDNFNFEVEKQGITEKILEHGTVETKNTAETFKRNIETRKTIIKSKKESRHIRTAEAKKLKKTIKQGKILLLRLILDHIQCGYICIPGVEALCYNLI